MASALTVRELIAKKDDITMTAVQRPPSYRSPNRTILKAHFPFFTRPITDKLESRHKQSKNAASQRAIVDYQVHMFFLSRVNMKVTRWPQLAADWLVAFDDLHGNLNCSLYFLHTAKSSDRVQ